uniref:Uncharacterized protein n=1 Tax=Rhizophora mucronata TaxID=61149 RepID=A0A2P2PZ97_RHIMU
MSDSRYGTNSLLSDQLQCLNFMLLILVLPI